MLDKKWNESKLNVGPKPAEYITLSTELSGHAHDYLQVVLGLEGKTEFDVNGRYNQIMSGQGCIVTPDLQHAFGSVGEPSNILVLNLPSEPSNGSAHQLAEKSDYFGINSQIIQLIKMLAKEVLSSPNDSVLCQACSDTIMALLYRHGCEFQAKSKMGRLDLDAIENYIEKHIRTKMSVAQLAGSVFLSESQFYHQFKKQTGMTPHQYVLIKRVEYAKQLIASDHVALNHISDLAGFSCHSAFTHAFKKYEGISPSIYKRRHH
jgi:AraC-like DNA-binding protein